jgi:hypothetical protein
VLSTCTIHIDVAYEESALRGQTQSVGPGSKLFGILLPYGGLQFVILEFLMGRRRRRKRRRGGGGEDVFDYDE